MTGDRDGQAAEKATLLVIAVDGVLGPHRLLDGAGPDRRPRRQRLGAGHRRRRRRARAVLHFVPWGAGGLSPDLMRRDRSARPGLNEFLISATSCPAWHSRFLVFGGCRDAPRVALAALRAGAFLDLAQAGGEAVYQAHRAPPPSG
jgi:hypothetical protein